ncbi:hypothetical protein D3C77_398820 [compost metagenome]
MSFFFWARLVDRTGNIGPWFPVEPNAVQGISSADAGPILEMISGQITESELGQHLLDRIDLIDGDGPGSVNERIGELQEEIGNIVDALAYVPTDAYVRDNTVRVGDNLWTAIEDVPAAADGSNGPPNPTYWVNSGQSIRAANGLAAQVNKNTADISTVDGKTTVAASQLQALQASYREDDGEGELADALKGWDSTASYAQEVKIRAESDFAQAQRTTVLDARVGVSEGRITTVETTVATNQSATSTALQQIQASVADNSAAIQQTSAAYADTAGKLSTMWSVKMQLNAQGQYVAAGIGLGIENGPAGLQSQFLVQADRFAVVNGINGALSAPFVVQNGQVFIDQAFINTAFIQQIVLDMTLRSQAVNAQGLPLIELNMVTGTFTVRGQDANGQTIINNGGMYVYDVNGVERVAVGRLT